MRWVPFFLEEAERLVMGGPIAWGCSFPETQLKRQLGHESMSTEGVTSALSHSEI